MSNKTATISVRIEPELKTEAEKILDDLNVSVSELISVLYKQIVIKQGVPFPIDLIMDDIQNERTAELVKLQCDEREVEVVKNFARMFKKKLRDIPRCDYGTHIYYMIDEAFIDNLVKDFELEKSGDTNGK